MKHTLIKSYICKLIIMTPAFSIGMTQMPDEVHDKNLAALFEERIELRKVCKEDEEKTKELCDPNIPRRNRCTFKSIEAGRDVLKKIQTESLKYDKAKVLIEEIVQKEVLTDKDFENYYVLNAHLPCSNSLNNWKRLFNTANQYPSFRPEVQKAFQSSVLENEDAGPSGLATLIELVLIKGASENKIIHFGSTAAFELAQLQGNMKSRMGEFSQELTKYLYVIKVPWTKKVYTFYNNEGMTTLITSEWRFSQHYRRKLDQWKEKYLN